MMMSKSHIFDAALVLVLIWCKTLSDFAFLCPFMSVDALSVS